MNYSLRTRLLLSAGILLAVFIGITGIILDRAFATSVQKAAYNSLQGQLFGLMAAVDVVDGRLRIPEALPEARFRQVDSGLYGEVRDGKGELLWRSNSLGGLALPAYSSLPGDFRYYESLPVVGGDLALIGMGVDVEWERDGGGSIPLSLLVAENRAPYDQQLSAYRRALWAWLGGLGLALLVLQLLLLYWALRPLGRVASEVGQIERGERKLLATDYPREVRPLSTALNRFIQHEAEQISRQRKLLGDLAHSLKTPITVLRGMWGEERRKESEAQLDQMTAIIDYQLQRASTVGRRVYADPISLRPEVARVLDSLNKVYLDKGVRVDVDIPEDAVFFGEKGDLTEIIGNLLDNAFKWAKSLVRISARRVNLGRLPPAARRRAAGAAPGLILKVEDDGAGIDPAQRKTVLRRGASADRRLAGQGIGLAVVADIVSAYDGTIAIRQSEIGGAELMLEFPST